MKRLSLMLPLTLASLTGFCQNKNLNAKYALKVYNTASWASQEEPFTSGIFSGTSTQKDFTPLHPSAAFRIKNQRNNAHELELSYLELGKSKTLSSVTTPTGNIPLSGATVTTSRIALRYEYVLNFLKKKDSRFMPALGLSAMPYFERSKSEPVLSTAFTETASRGGVRTFVIPRVQYALSSRVFLDLNIPLCITDTYFKKTGNQNPLLPAEEQNYSTGNFEALPKLYSVRVGVGVNL